MSKPLAAAGKLQERCNELEAENAALREELATLALYKNLAAQYGLEAFGDLESLQKDAERYRWLCEGLIIPKPSLWDSGIGFARSICGLPVSGRIDKSELDAAIDDAIAKENGK